MYIINNQLSAGVYLLLTDAMLNIRQYMNWHFYMQYLFQSKNLKGTENLEDLYAETKINLKEIRCEG